MSSAAWQLKEEEEPDFSLIWLHPPVPLSVSSLPFPISRQSFTRQHASAAVKSTMNLHSSSYLRQTISICTALFSLMANRRAASCSSSSISILLWRVHPLALHLIALSAWPRNSEQTRWGLRIIHCQSFIQQPSGRCCSGPLALRQCAGTALCYWWGLDFSQAGCRILYRLKRRRNGFVESRRALKVELKKKNRGCSKTEEALPHRDF